MDMNVMFSRIADPQMLRTGDLIYWPGEPGRRLHIHGSASTFRKLGFSVGNRWHAIGYPALRRMFQDSPERTRMFLVTSVETTGYSPDQESVAEANLFGNSAVNATVTDERPSDTVKIAELPLKMPEHGGDSDELFAIFDDCEVLLKWLLGAMRVHGYPVEWAADYNGQEEIEHIHRYYSSEHLDMELYVPSPDEDWKLPDEIRGKKYAEISDEDALKHLSKVIQNIIRTRSRSNGSIISEVPRMDVDALMNVDVVKNAAPYGVLALRPTDEFIRRYSEMLLSYIAERVSQQMEVISKYADEFVHAASMDSAEIHRRAKTLEEDVTELADANLHNAADIDEISTKGIKL